jgi:hypothetical protein
MAKFLVVFRDQENESYDYTIESKGTSTEVEEVITSILRDLACEVSLIRETKEGLAEYQSVKEFLEAMEEKWPDKEGKKRIEEVKI